MTNHEGSTVVLYCGVVRKSEMPTKAMLAAIGSVASECAAVEDRLRDLFSYLIDSPYGQVIAAGEDISNITKMCLRAARYNSGLSDEQVEQLVALMKAVEALRPHRNFLVHAVWTKVSGPGNHIGVRSSRASTSMRAAAQGTSEGYRWTPEDAQEIAGQFRQLAEYIDIYIERTFDRPPYPPLIEREAWKKLEDFLSFLGDTPGGQADRSGD